VRRSVESANKHGSLEGKSEFLPTCESGAEILNVIGKKKPEIEKENEWRLIVRAHPSQKARRMGHPQVQTRGEVS
jgi:hypothetical protein